MPEPRSNPRPAGVRLPPQVVLLLDDQTRVLNENRSLAGNSFPLLSASERPHLHAWLHPKCDGACLFREMWAKAWGSLKTRDSVEWEINDNQLNRLLRLNLSKSPRPRTIGPDRRKPQILLTITDITRYRLEYEALVEQQRSFFRLLLAEDRIGVELENDNVANTSESGRYLMSGFVPDLKPSGRQLLLAQEEERKRIAAELHDGLVQTVCAVKYKVEACLDEYAAQQAELDLDPLESVIVDLKHVVEEIRRISRNLAPTVLQDFGIQFALDWLCREFSERNSHARAVCETSIDESELPDLIKFAIYRVVQEALNNAAKHASANRIEVTLEAIDNGILLTIADDGVGIDPARGQGDASVRGGFGLRSMRERIEATEGVFEMESAPGKGVLIRAEWDAEALGLNR